MPVLTFGAQRREVHVGRNTVGGTGDIVFSALAGLPPLAAITLTAEGDATIALIDEDISVLVDDASLGTEPTALRDGSTVQIGDRQFIYRAEPTSIIGAVGSGASVSSEESGWRLIELQTGRVHEIPPQGLVIGRDDDCDLVVASQDVSRRHAVIRKVGTGFTVTDESVNGTFVNDARVQSVQTLARGDKLRVGTIVFRLERAALSASSTGDATLRLPSVELSETSADSKASPEPGNAQRAGGPPAPPPPPPPPDVSTSLAALEVVRGPLSGTRLPLTRAVTSIGRAEENDIVIADDSVSSSHATILLKAGSWYVVDLRSANGTFVDGYRVAGERMLSAGSLLTVGQVKMIFWPASHLSQEQHGTQPLLGMFRQLAKLIRNR